MHCNVVSRKQWQAIVFPLFLTALPYLGPLMAGALEQFNEWKEECVPSHKLNVLERWRCTWWTFLQSTNSLAANVFAWRTFVVAPLTEEIVFRACMIPTLLCAGFQHLVIILFCPLFFGLAHLNHFWELVYLQKWDKKRAFLVVGMQLGYTTVFGWYASFLHLRTGNLLAPLVAHIFCNIMGFPDLGEAFQSGGLISICIGGFISFFLMLGPASDPLLYNDIPKTCNCWLGYCKW